MTITDLLQRFPNARKTRDGWMVPCPVHEDSSPSLSLSPGDDGRILVHCHAGCETKEILLKLDLTWEDVSPARPTARGSVPAPSCPPVAGWLRARGISQLEVGTLRAMRIKDGHAVVFPYVDVDGRLVYEKVRPIGKKKFWRVPAGTESLIYGLGELGATGGERAIVVEGELDVHALRSVDIGNVVSVPDGANSKLTDSLLLPLAAFREIIVATDSDGPGQTLAAALAKALGPERCRRATFGEAKDANDALKAGWDREAFEKAFANAPSMEAPLARDVDATDEEATQAETHDENTAELVRSPVELRDRYVTHNGNSCYRRTDRQGNQVLETLANFTAEILEEVAYDDGAEVRREFRIVGRMASGQPLPEARVQSAEFASLGWVTREWGARAVLAAGQGSKDHLRTSIQLHSQPSRRTIYRHTGWVKLPHSPAPVFLYQGGAIGAEAVEVDLPPPLDRFRFPAQVEDLVGAIRVSLRILECGPFAITVPLLASVYLAPVASLLNPDTTVWLYGASGSMKSTISALAQAHFGTFDRKTLSATWSSTDNALEIRLHALKDLLSVIDDFAPQDDPRAMAELIRRVQRIIRNIGNCAGRGRLNADLTPRIERNPRGFLLCNGESLPPGYSIVARLFPIEIERRKLDIPVITEVQREVARLPHAMRGYLEWLAPQYATLERTLPAARDELRDQLQKGASHLRQPEAIANLFVGFDLLLQFAQASKALEPELADRFRRLALKSLQASSATHAEGLSELNPAERFIETLCTLFAQQKICLLDPDAARGPLDRTEVIGWRRGDLALLLPDAAVRCVSLFFRDSGDMWAPSPRDLHRELVARQYALQSQDGRDAGQWRVQVGHERKKRRGWLIPTSFLGLPATDGPSALNFLGAAPNSEVATDGAISAKLQLNLGDASHASHAPSFGGGGPGCAEDDGEKSS